MFSLFVEIGLGRRTVENDISGACNNLKDSRAQAVKLTTFSYSICSGQGFFNVQFCKNCAVLKVFLNFTLMNKNSGKLLQRKTNKRLNYESQKR